MIDAYFGKSLSIWRLSRRSEQTDESAGLMRLSRSKKTIERNSHESWSKRERTWDIELSCLDITWLNRLREPKRRAVRRRWWTAWS
ncbi:MAG: hypothetical protein ACTS43_01115 [Candidatus Hodgkinia cicadicola]